MVTSLMVTFWIGVGSILAKAPQFPLPVYADSCPSQVDEDLFNGTSFSALASTNLSSIIGEFTKNTSTIVIRSLESSDETVRYLAQNKILTTHDTPLAHSVQEKYQKTIEKNSSNVENLHSPFFF